MKSKKLYDIVTAAVFTAIICVLSLIAIPTAPIPFTLGVLSIFLTGAILRPRYAFLSVCAYLILGTIGLPVFAGFKSGIGVFSSFTGGFLLSYPFMALIVSLFVYKTNWNKTAALIVGLLIALFVCYMFGSLWVKFVVAPDWTLKKAIQVCAIPYIPFDLLKCVATVILSTAIKKVVEKTQYAV